MAAIRPALVSLSLLACALLSGCSNLFGPATPASENWLITGNLESADGSIYGISIGGSLINISGSISGVFHVYDALQTSETACFDNGTLDFPYTGTLTNNNLSITSSPANGQVLTLQGVLSSDGSKLTNGYFTITGGCIGSLASLTGSNGPGSSLTPTGQQLRELAGTWNPVPNSTLTLTEQLTQSPTPDAHGDFALSGAVTVQGSPCFTQGTLQSPSFVSGSQGHQTILMNDGSTLSATLALSIPSSSSTPSYLGLYPGTITGGNCNGPVDITLQ